MNLVSLLVCMSVATVSQQATTNSNNVDIESKISTTEVLVVLSTEESLKWKEYSVEDFEDVDCIAVEDLTSAYKNKTTLKNDFKRILKISFEEKSINEVYNIIDTLNETYDEIEYAGPNYQLEVDLDEELNNNSRSVNSVDYNWGLGHIGVHDAYSLIDAYDIYPKNINVGVVEEGIDGTHQDLINNINTSLSISFVEELNPYDDINESNPFEDPTSQSYSHGTFVAGIIAASINEEEGTEGVCHNAQIVSYKYYVNMPIYNDNNYEDIILSFNQATQDNIRIMNCSWGDSDYDIALKTSMNNYEGLIICAAGNDYYDIDEIPLYPAAFDLDNIITVGAIDIGNTIWYGYYDDVLRGSNYGVENVDVFAPGHQIKSTTKNNSYAIKSGTSYAVPFVSGLAAILLSIEEETDDGVLTTAELKELIMDSVDEISSLSDKCVTGGVVNAFSAVAMALDYQLTYSYRYYDEVYHEVIPEYGTSYLEEHFYVPVFAGGVVSSYALPGASYFRCNKCGAQKLSL